MLNLLHTSASASPGSETSLKGTTLSSPKHYGWVPATQPHDKTIEQILEETNTLITAGVQELILIAKDLGCKDSCNLISLIKTILNTDQQFSLRLLNLYPEAISDELIALMKADSRILPYLDILMETKYLVRDTQQITSITSKLRAEIPHITLRASLVIGMPGETEAQFQSLCQFITDAHLDNISIVPFSALANDDLTKTRCKTLSALQQKLVCKKNTALIGTQLDVLIEGYHPESRLLMRGRHNGQCPKIDGSVIINDGRKVTAFGKKYRVEITDVSDQDLIGRVI